MSDFQIKDGGFYRTRSGEKAEVLSYSLTRDCWLGFRPDGAVAAWHSDGRRVVRMAHESALSNDLIASWTEPKKGTVWVNVYEGHCHGHTTRADADEGAGKSRLACVFVNWTEGEGLR